MKKMLLAVTLLFCAAQAGLCAGWTPLKLELFKNAAFPAVDTVYGFDIGVANDTDWVSGLQLGVYNSADNMRGLQFGLVNVCRNTLKGVQLGFANIGGRNTVLPVTVGLNIGF